MKANHGKVLGIFLTLAIVALGFWGCEEAVKPIPEAAFEVIPQKIALTPDLLKEPLQFKGSRFAPKEIVVIEMVLPPGVKVKTVKEGENVGLAYATANEKGEIQTKMEAGATLNWFFQVDWAPNMKPDMSKATPLPPGKYEIRASGMDSGAIGKAILEIAPPPPKS